MSMLRVVTCGFSGSTYFSTLSHKLHDFRNQVTEHNVCVLIFCTTIVQNFPILRRTEQDMIKNAQRSSCKVLVSLSNFNKTGIFKTNFENYSNIKKCSRYRPGVAQSLGTRIALLFHDRDIRRGWVVSSTSRPLFTPGKDPVPIVQEAGWAPGPLWTGGKSHPHRYSIPDLTARSQSLYRLSYPAHTKILNFMQILSVADELFRADGQTDMRKLIVALCNFAEAPKNFNLSLLGHSSTAFIFHD